MRRKRKFDQGDGIDFGSRNFAMGIPLADGKHQDFSGSISDDFVRMPLGSVYIRMIPSFCAPMFVPRRVTLVQVPRALSKPEGLF